MKKINKVKTYVLILSTRFPVYHWSAGKETFFAEKLNDALSGNDIPFKKLHTIRANYELWAKRFKKIATGEAVLSIRIWIGKPYGKGSSMKEVALLTCENGIGIQKLKFKFDENHNRIALVDGVTLPSISELAHNDGLTYHEWISWFQNYNLEKPMAIIHFTDFLY